MPSTLSHRYPRDGVGTGSWDGVTTPSRKNGTGWDGVKFPLVDPVPTPSRSRRTVPSEPDPVPSPPGLVDPGDGVSRGPASYPQIWGWDGTHPPSPPTTTHSGTLPHRVKEQG